MINIKPLHKKLIFVVTLIFISSCVFGCARGDLSQEEGPVVIKVAFWGGPEETVWQNGRKIILR